MPHFGADSDGDLHFLRRRQHLELLAIAHNIPVGVGMNSAISSDGSLSGGITSPTNPTTVG
jgi:hypothetical protein